MLPWFQNHQTHSLQVWPAARMLSIGAAAFFLKAVVNESK